VIKLQKIISHRLDKVRWATFVKRVTINAKSRDKTKKVKALKLLSRHESTTARYASAWMTALPTSKLHKLKCFDFLVNLRFRLGLAPLSPAELPDKCRCGVSIKNSHDHYLICNKIRKDGRHDTIASCLGTLGRKAGLLAWMEPKGLNQNDLRRTDILLDGATISAELDVSVTHPAAASNLSASIPTQLKSAQKREAEKMNKHGAECEARNTTFYPAVLESYGAFGKSLQTWCSRLSKVWGDHIGRPLSSYEYYTWIIQPVSCSNCRGHALLIKQGIAASKATANSKDSRFLPMMGV
jgi:hypothetical protein